METSSEKQEDHRSLEDSNCSSIFCLYFKAGCPDWQNFRHAERTWISSSATKLPSILRTFNTGYYHKLYQVCQVYHKKKTAFVLQLHLRTSSSIFVFLLRPSILDSFCSKTTWQNHRVANMRKYDKPPFQGEILGKGIAKKFIKGIDRDIFLTSPPGAAQRAGGKRHTGVHEGLRTVTVEAVRSFAFGIFALLFPCHLAICLPFWKRICKDPFCLTTLVTADSVAKYSTTACTCPVGARHPWETSWL